MIEFVVCDDEANVLKDVSFMINKTMEKHSFTYNIITFSDYDNKFERYLANNNKQVVYILDLEMPTESGVSVARRIRNIDKKSIIIILTSHHESADAIYKGRLNILTFVSKKDRCEQSLLLALDEAVSYFSDNNELITFSDLGNNYSISAKDILYIVKEGRMTIVKMSHDEYPVYLSLDKFKQILPNYFKQSHRACLVNMHRVIKVSLAKKLIYFDNGDAIDYVGDKYRGELVK